MIEKDQPINKPDPTASTTILDYVNPSSDRRPQALHRILLLLVGGVVLLVIASLFSKGIGHAREPANRIKCASNLRQIGQSIQIYAQANGGVTPRSFDDTIESDDLTPEVFVCPSSNDLRAAGPTTQALLRNFHQKGFCSYVYALPGSFPISSITAKHVVAYEPVHNHPRKDGVAKGINVLYGDGTVSWLDEAEGKRVIADVQAGHNPPRPTATGG
jgi:hypothetical protein